MTLFSYQVVNTAGETEEGVREAFDEGSCVEQLQADGYIPIRVTPAQNQTFLGFSLKPRGSKLSTKNIVLFTGELAMLLESGLPLDRALAVLMDLASNDEALSKIIERILEKVKSGVSLADALEQQSGVFSKFYLNMIRAGEAGGNLDEVYACCGFTIKLLRYQHRLSKFANYSKWQY